MKQVFTGIAALVLCLCLAACTTNSKDGGTDSAGNISGPEETILQPREVAEKFFEGFEQADYPSMESYCTSECISAYFHDADVFGMVWARATHLEETADKALADDERKVFVDVEMETAQTSALYPETETSFYVILKQQNDRSWLIDQFVTG
ncbi:MAG: hypothetical protein AB7C89_01115 [Intestinibacillus sp.]